MIEIPHIDWFALQNGFTALLVGATLLQMVMDRLAVDRAFNRLVQALDDEDETLPENIEGPLEANVVYPEFRPAPAPEGPEVDQALHLLSMMRHALATGKQHQIDRFRPRLEEAGVPIPVSVEHCDTLMRALRGKESA